MAKWRMGKVYNVSRVAAQSWSGPIWSGLDWFGLGLSLSLSLNLHRPSAALEGLRKRDPASLIRCASSRNGVGMDGIWIS
ncbi:hypothetical protein ColLi_10106 [Colletotrichum liriopes]|uniref:Uncharacterized protein n=1 Tax=Colletotrichum liriopes TaxID=708192 RepID=A0AA37LX75_9PEZI|nr:hypothetical protein ColLi_10106 [Colletotrichum liriopes]